MRQSLGLVSLVVRDYDEAIAFFVDRLGFRLVEDTCVPEQDKRWVVVSPPGAVESRLLLARASSPGQAARIGAQTGGRVFLFLHTDDFWRDYEAYRAKGVVFVREPKTEAYGTVAVFRDLYGNLWDLLQPTAGYLARRHAEDIPSKRPQAGAVPRRAAECSCGQLGLVAEGEPLRVSICHCLACQRRSGSAFAVQARFPAQAVAIRGRSHQYVRTGDEGGSCRFHFCPECGTTVYFVPDSIPDVVSVPVGVFADPGFPPPQVSVYEVRRHAWVGLPGDIGHID